MSIIARNNKRDFAPAPEGLWPAVCIDVVDLGMLKTPWGEAHKVELRWVISELMPDTGKPFMLVKRYTLSLHEKANLRRELETWRGKKFSAEESEGFDLENLLGANCQLQVIHNAKDDGTVFSNVQAIVPPGRGLPKLPIPTEYVRAINRDGSTTGSKKSAAPDGQKTGPIAQAPASRLLNHEEMAMFWTAVKGWGWNDKTVHKALIEGYGFASVKDIPRSRLESVLKWFQASKTEPQQESEPWPDDGPITDADIPF